MPTKKDQVAETDVTDEKVKKAPTAKKTATAKSTAEKADKPAAVKKTADAAASNAPKAKPAPASAAKQASGSVTPRGRLKEKFVKEIVSSLSAERGYKNVNEVPALSKIVLNMRIGDIKDNSKSIQQAQKELDAIAGQKTIIVKAKKSVANFKLRENQPIGIKVTLRGNRMYEFFDRLVAIALPRVRDFRGVSGKSFDGRGNYAMGVKEQITFPEISYETVEKVRGFDICIVTTAKSDDEAKALLTKLGMPFKN